MKNECMGGSGRRPISVEESVKRWIHCSWCGRVLRIRPHTDPRTQITDAAIPRHRDACLKGS
jgi:hypothetical protein